ncbi:MAG: RNA polymerase sigma factor, partial [Acidobacteriaceae bacterium]
SYLEDAAAAHVAEVPETPPEALARNIKRTELEEAIRYLPSTGRLLFLLRDVEGYTPAAIAQLLRIPESQVQRQLLTTRIQLRRLLAEAQDRQEKAA